MNLNDGHNAEDDLGNTFLVPIKSSDELCDEIMQSNKCYNDLYDDLLVYIFKYLSPNELITIGNTNKRLRELSLRNEAWEIIYFKNIYKLKDLNISEDENYRKIYIDYCKEHSLKAKRVKKGKKILPLLSWYQFFYQLNYGFLGPFLFCNFILIFSILVPLIFDGFIDTIYIGYCSLPFFMAMAILLFICISLIIDPYYFNSKRLKYANYLKDEDENTIIKAMSSPSWSSIVMNDEEPSLKSDDGWKESIIIVLSTIWIWFLFIFGILMKYMWFYSSNGATFTLLFTPCYLFTIIYCILPFIYFTRSRRKRSYSSSSNVMSYFSYIMYTIIVVMSALQILLIGLKLDYYITSSWNVVLVPAWLFLIYVNCLGCIHCYCIASTDNRTSGVLGCCAVLSHMVFAFSYQIWFIIIALRLDQVFESLWTPLFIPFWIFILLVECITVFTSGMCMVFKYCDYSM
ncbi:hypothetical protein ABK040_000596 [Willaertia magna]